MTKLIYPTLDLFVYDLRDGLGQSDEQLKQNQNNFKQRFTKNDDEEKLFDDKLDKGNFETEYVELLGEQRIKQLPPSSIIDGYYYPVRLSDTYGLLLNCTLKNEQDLKRRLKKLKSLLIKKISAKTNTLGQTWMFSAGLPSYSYEDCEAIAKDFYNTLMNGSYWENNKIGKSDFIGGTIFELWGYTSANKTKNIHEKYHVIIALYPALDPAHKTLKKLALFYPDWMRLFCYRHKILWAYAQSQQLQKRLKKGDGKIQDCRREISLYSSQQLECEEIKETLDKAWSILSSYTTDLNQLDDQARTIDINLHNYKKRLVLIKQKAMKISASGDLPVAYLGNSGEVSGKNLKFLKKFSNDVKDKYLLQIQKDHANFSPGLRLLENLIDYIRARVEIEEERRDRNFEKNFAIVGIGMATAGIVGGLPYGDCWNSWRSSMDAS